LNNKRPSGCPICGRQRQIQKATKSFDNFVKDSRVIHGDIYEYQEESYKRAKSYIQIKCRLHGLFPQTPDSHINGKHGCPKCRDEFVAEKSRLEFDEIYKRLNKNSKKNITTVNFSRNRYLGVNSKLIINCSKHGVQDGRLVNSMLYQTHPCVECTFEIIGSRVRKRSTENVIQYLNEKFEGKYKIYDFKYEDKRTLLRFYCPIEGHGDFSFQVNTIYKSNGCPVCSYENSQEKRTEGLRRQIETSKEKRRLKWIDKVKSTHGDLYDYSLVEFVDVKTPVTIICRNHGEIEQVPDVHIQSGCRKCADEDLKGKYTKKYFDDYPERKDRTATLYYIKFTYKHEIFYKVGITTTSIKARFGTIDKKVISIDVINYLNTFLYNAWELEVIIQNVHGDRFRYRPIIDGRSIRKYRIGQSECFSQPLPNKILNKYFLSDK
jgi:hypothetical protein